MPSPAESTDRAEADLGQYRIEHMTDIQLFARPLGSMQWVCPRCGYIHGTEKIDWRTARTHCNQCEANYRLGVIFFEETTHRRPYLARLLPEYVGAANRLGEVKSEIGTAAFIGRLDWCCPSCLFGQTTKLDRASKVTCLNCTKPFWVGPIIYPAPTGRACRTPLDWSIQGVREATQSVHPTEAR